MNQSQGMAEMTAASAAGEMNQEGIRGIVMEGNCNRRRWARPRQHLPLLLRGREPLRDAARQPDRDSVEILR